MAAVIGFLTTEQDWKWWFEIAIQMLKNSTPARCMKIIEKVAFSIASEPSYIYILSGQKLIKNAKNVAFCQVFENLKLSVKQCYQTGSF